MKKKTKTYRFKYQDKIYTLNEIADYVHMDPETLRSRLKRGMSIGEAISIPVRSPRERRRYTMISYKGKTQSISEWAEELGIPRTTIATRMSQYGCTFEQAVEFDTRQLKDHNSPTITLQSDTTGLSLSETIERIKQKEALKRQLEEQNILPKQQNNMHFTIEYA